jgi:NAD(P)H-hydrate epimerase
MPAAPTRPRWFVRFVRFARFARFARFVRFVRFVRLQESAMPPTMRLTRDEARRCDEIATNELLVPTLLLMENAGRGAAEVVHERYAPLKGGRCFVFCGPGNNGGDGFVVARHLLRLGETVVVKLCGARDRLAGDAAVNCRIVERLGIGVREVRDDGTALAAAGELTPNDVVIDALLGTGFQGSVRAPMATLIERLNRARADGRARAVVAIDLPSGLDCDTGAPSNATIRADLTVTFVAPKVGFAAAGTAPFIGEVVVRDIGVPAASLVR